MIFERMTEIVGLGIKSLMRNKLRSLLTMLGMIFGVGSVIAMLSVGAGARHEILSRIGQLGIRNIIVNSVKPPEESRPEDEHQWKNQYGLTFKDAEYIAEVFPSVERILRVNKVRERVWYGSRRVEGSILGVAPDYMATFGFEAERGRVFNEVDSRECSKVCVVRGGLMRELESLDEPLGAWLRIGEYSFQVIGILSEDSVQSHTRKALDLDGRAQEVYIPYTTSMRTFGTVTYIQRAGSEEFTEVDLDQIVVTTKASDDVFPTAQVLASALEHSHDRQDYEIVVPLELLQQSENTQKVFNIVMVLIASISLLVGGIGIANIMLATITERTKEIGVRRALGAKRRDIVVQFLTETTVIAAIGGILGCLFGIGGILGIVRFTQWKALVAPHYVLISLLISCTVGIVFGIWPARRASKMDPITALRYE